MPIEIAAVGTRVASRYRVQAVVSRGDGAVTYRVYDEERAEPVWLRQLAHPNERSGGELGFEQEYRKLAAFSHPNIARAHAFDRAEGGPYYTTECLSQGSWCDGARSSHAEIVAIAADVAVALALLHRARLAHGEVNTETVRIADSGHAKLCEFSSLTGFGARAPCRGAPSFKSPEAVHGAISGQSDLYALGALMYRALTGHDAYPASHMEELFDAWKRPLTPPSQLADVPDELEALLVSLLSLDPKLRPPSAVDVFDRLLAILPERLENHARPPRSFVDASLLCARTEELRRIRRALEQLKQGSGSAMLIEGKVGAGKTRLLQESFVEAQRCSVVVVSADAECESGPLGLAISVSRELFRRSPALAKEAALGCAAVLSSIIPELSGSPSGARVPVDADGIKGEARFELQTAIAQYCLDFSRRQPLLLAIDNLQAADEASATLFALMARECYEAPLLCLAAARTADDQKGCETARVFRRRAETLTLANLREDDTLELLASLLGRQPGLKRLVQRVQAVGSGNPAASVALVEHLVATGAIVERAAGFQVPSELPPAALSSATLAADFLPIERLDEPARALAEALSVQRGMASLELCVELAGSREPAFSALSSLLAQGVLSEASGGYRFSREPVKRALYESLDPARRQELHKAVATLLLAQAGGDPALELEAGFQLLSAAENERAAELLGKAGLALMYRGQLGAAQPGLEAALRAIGSSSAHGQQRIAILVPLVMSGYQSNREIAERYGPEALSLLVHATGLDVMQRARRWLGKRLALYLGLTVALSRYWRTPKRYRLLEFKTILEHLVRGVGALIGVAAVCLDRERVQLLAGLIEPFTQLKGALMVRHMHAFCLQLADAMGDHLALVHERWLELSAAISESHARGEFRKDAYPLYFGGALYALGILEAFADDQRALDRARSLEEFGLKHLDTYATQLRVAYHAHRGEHAAVERQRERLEALALARSSSWTVEIWVPSALSVAYVRSGDVVGAKRCAEELERFAKEIPSLALYATLAKANYRLLRGDTAEAIRLYEAILGPAEPRSFIGWSSVRAAYALALNSAGRHEQARQVCLTTLSSLSDADRVFVGMTLRVEIELSLAESGLGRHAEAARRLAELSKRFSGSTNPLVKGPLHRARAEVALASEDQATFREQLSSMEEVLLPTANPTLIAECERLRERGRRFISVRPSASLAIAADVRPRVEPSTSAIKHDLSAVPSRSLNGQRHRH